MTCGRQAGDAFQSDFFRFRSAERPSGQALGLGVADSIQASHQSCRDPIDGHKPLAVLTSWTAIGGAATNLEDLQERSAAWATPSFVAFRQEGTLGHSLDELLRARAAHYRCLKDLVHFQKQTLELARRKHVHPFGRIDPRLK